MVETMSPESKKLKTVPKRSVVLHPYTRQWKQRYKDICAHIRGVLLDIDFDIRHIGSTSVDGMVAKPIIDIVIGVNDDKALSVCSQILTNNSYSMLKGLLTVMPNRRVFWAGTPEYHSAHLHVVIKGSPDWYDLIQFKALLERDDNSKRRYIERKVYLAEKYPNDINAYIDGKMEIYFDLLKIARELQSA